MKNIKKLKRNMEKSIKKVDFNIRTKADINKISIY